MSTVQLKTSFSISKQLQPLHSGGPADTTQDGSWLATTLNDSVAVTDVASGERIALLEGDTSDVTSLCFAARDPQLGGSLLVCHQSLALRIYSLPNLELVHTIARAHEAPIITCAADASGTLLATGAADGTVKVWDARRAHCTHVLTGHGGVVSALLFDIVSGTTRARLISGADDTKIRVWDLRTRACLAVLDGHFSVVRGLDLNTDHSVLVSGSRDKVLNFWNMDALALKKTVPVFESLEAAGFLGDDTVYCAGERGSVRVFDVKSGEEISLDDWRALKASSKGKHAIDHHKATKPNETKSNASKPKQAETAASKSEPQATKVLPITAVIRSDKTITTVDVDMNFITYSLPSLAQTRQLVGYNDEIIDVALLDTQLAVATNSHLIKNYDLQQNNAQLLEGHSDTVLCLAPSHDASLFVSGSKDKTAVVWHKEGDYFTPLARAVGHTESIGAVAFSRKSNHFIATASQDNTVKIWHLAKGKLTALVTVKAHEKDINAIDIAPNDKFLVTGSQDRTAKLFAINFALSASAPAGAVCELSHVGTFTGHRRGVWSVRFSTADRLLATSSADKSIKLWSLTDYSCIKTFEGHSNSVLRVNFLSDGQQLASSGSDGLVKIWNIKEESCVTTLDNHEDKIWALAVSPDESRIVSGAADSTITIWEDTTEATQLQKIAEQEEEIVKNQEFENYIAIKDYSSAIWIALEMNQPRRLLRLFTLVQTSFEPGSITGSAKVDNVVEALDRKHLRQLIEYISLWNTNARTSSVAQGVLNAVFKFFPVSEILEALEEDDSKNKKPASQVLDGLISYSERYLARTDRILRESYIVEHLLGLMDTYEEAEPMEVDLST